LAPPFRYVSSHPRQRAHERRDVETEEQADKLVDPAVAHNLR